MKRSIRWAVPVLLATGLLAACSSGDVSFDSPAGAPADMAAESMPGEASSSVDMRQEVIRTANITLEVDDVDQSIASISAQVNDQGGFIQSRNITNYDDDATASLTIRIPAGNLDAFVESLQAEGTVVNSSVDAQDVTLEVVDLEARISTLEASIERLRELQQQATSVADLVAVESELANRQAELESLTARRDFLANQVDLSTVYIWIEQRDTGAALTPDFLGGLQRGWDALATLGAGLVTVVGFLLPTALVGLAVAAVVIFIVRHIRGRTKRKERT